MLALAENHYAAAVILAIVNLLWLFSIIFGLPGTWFMVLSTGVFAWLAWQPGQPLDNQPIHVWTLLSLVVLALLGEVLEFIAGAMGARKAGGSSRGALAAVFGGIVGAIVGTFVIPIPILGSLMGAAGGAGLAAYSIELASGKSVEVSMRIGMGAGVGRLLGTVYKLGVGAVIWVVATLAAFWP